MSGFSALLFDLDGTLLDNAGLPSVCVTFGYCHVPFDFLDAAALSLIARA